jgi:hypothetical protein
VLWQLAAILLLVAIALWVLLRYRSRAGAASAGGVAAGDVRPIAPSPAAALASGPKPEPKEITFDGCPPEGDGSNRALNRLKNRVDDGSYSPVTFDTLLALPEPRLSSTNRRLRAVERAAAVKRYQGVPIAVEGYLAGAKEEGPESPNCHGADSRYRDWHLWLTGSPTDDRRRSVVVETTPRVRASHPRWRLEPLKRVARAHQPVRISGWLLFDPEHPDQLDRTRGTLWEIHPIMRIDVRRRGSWVPLDGVR